MNDESLHLRRTETRSEQPRPIAKLQFNQKPVKPQNQSASNNSSSQEKNNEQ